MVRHTSSAGVAAPAKEHLTHTLVGQISPEKVHMSKKIVVNRSAETGKFVTPKYAQSHPKTTEKETYKGK
jgi:hypothetical protein